MELSSNLGLQVDSDLWAVLLGVVPLGAGGTQFEDRRVALTGLAGRVRVAWTWAVSIIEAFIRQVLHDLHVLHIATWL